MRGAGVIWLASTLLLALPGAPLLARRAYAGIPLLARAVLAGAAGAVLISFTMTLFALLGLSWSVPGVLAAATVLGFVISGPRRSRDSRDFSVPEELRLPGTKLPASVAAVAVVAALLGTAAGSATSPDLLFFWGAKAQQFAFTRTIDATYLGDPSLSYMHAYYPPLITNLYAFASMAAGRMSWTAATLLFPVLLAKLAVALPGILRLQAPARRAASASALAVAAIACIGLEADIAGNAEMPLLLFETLAIALLLGPLALGAAGQLLAGILLAGAVTAKIEGLPFALAAIVAFLGLRRRERVGAAALRLLGPTVLSLAAWFAFGATRNLFWGYSGEGKFFDFHPAFAGAVLRAIAHALAAAGYGLPYLIPLAGLLAGLRWLGASAAVPLAAAAGIAAFGFVIYLDRPADPTIWIAWSAARVFSPIPVAFALALGAQARDDPAATA